MRFSNRSPDYIMKEKAIDPNVCIGHVHLKVANLQRALDFYCGVLGFELTQRYGEEVAFVSAGGYHHHIGLNTWESRDGSPPPPGTTGLYHFAILYPTRAALADALRRLIAADIPLDGASDHGVSEALYLRDPDQNGVELYWDRPKEVWPRGPNGEQAMFTVPHDLFRRAFIHPLPEMAVANAVEEVNDEPNGEPNEKSNPCHDWQAQHQCDAENHADNWEKRNHRNPKRPRPVRIGSPENHHAEAHQDEGEERANIRQVRELTDVRDHRDPTHQNTRGDSGNVGRAVTRMDAGEKGRQETVARHGHENTRLA